MTQGEFANHRGISQQRVSVLVRSGVIPTADGKILVAEADRVLDARRNLDRSGRAYQATLEAVDGDEAADSDNVIPLQEALRRKTAAQARLLETELQEKQGDLVDRETVLKEWEKVLMACKLKLEAIGYKNAKMLAVETDPRQCQRIIDDSVRDALDELTRYNSASRPGRAGAQDTEAGGAAQHQPVGRPGKDAQPRKQRRAR